MSPTLTAGDAGDERDFTSDALPHDDIPVATTAVMLPPVEGLCCERDATAGSRRVRGAPLILNVPAAPLWLREATCSCCYYDNSFEQSKSTLRPRSAAPKPDQGLPDALIPPFARTRHGDDPGAHGGV